MSCNLIAMADDNSKKCRCMMHTANKSHVVALSWLRCRLPDSMVSTLRGGNESRALASTDPLTRDARDSHHGRLGHDNKLTLSKLTPLIPDKTSHEHLDVFQKGS